MSLNSGKSPIIELIGNNAIIANRISYTGMNVILVIFGSLLLAISAQYKVPLGPVPITLQSLVVMLIATLYGWKLGAATIVAYWTEGILVGGLFAALPWFANGSGLAYFIGSPSSGFLWGFLPMVLVISFIKDNINWLGSRTKILIGLILGQGVLYLFGLAHAYFLIMPFVDWMNTPFEMLAIYVYPFIIGDILKTLIAILLTISINHNIRERIKHERSE